MVNVMVKVQFCGLIWGLASYPKFKIKGMTQINQKSSGDLHVWAIGLTKMTCEFVTLVPKSSRQLTSTVGGGIGNGVQPVKHKILLNRSVLMICTNRHTTP